MKIIFFGTPDFSIPTLKALIDVPGVEVACVVTQPDRPQGRGNHLQHSPIKKIALSHHIPVVQPENIRKSESKFIDTLKELGPFEIGVVVAFGQILPESVLNLPNHGSLNVHASVLPRWRGAAPIQRAIMAGDKTTGISLMKMEAGLDTGPVYCTERVTIEEFDTFETLHDRLSHVGAKLLAKNIRAIIDGKLLPEIQPQEGVTYAHKIETDEALIDWRKSASEISRIIRAMNPFPGAFTFIQSKRLKIFEAQPVTPLRKGEFAAGEIISIDAVRLEVKCGEEALALLQVQMEGKRKMSISDFLRGFPVRLSDKLGTEGAH